MLFVEARESVRCLEECVRTSALDANVGSILRVGCMAGRRPSVRTDV
jgi:hypothetical protein